MKNGDIWIVERQHRNGDLTVHDHRGTRVRLPHRYVTSDVQLGYATTTTRAQGRTVDTAHALIDATSTREALYVAATRARSGTHLYVQNEYPLGLDAERPPIPRSDASDLLASVLTHEAAERTATEVRRGAATAVRAQARRVPAVDARPHPSQQRRDTATLRPDG